MLNTSLDTLLKKGLVWRANNPFRHQPQALASGYHTLDAMLPGGGWPTSAVTELLCDRHGIGELRLLTPALQQLCQQQRWIAWIAPPFIPYAPALTTHDIDLTKVLVIQCHHTRDIVWAAEQCLLSGSCSSVLCWPEQCRYKTLQRLQLAAKQGDSLGFFFRSHQAAQQPSPAPLRIKISTQSKHLHIELLKRQGGWACPPMALQPIQQQQLTQALIRVP